MKRLKSLDAWRVSKELALATEGYGLGTRPQLIRCVRIAVIALLIGLLKRLGARVPR